MWSRSVVIIRSAAPPESHSRMPCISAYSVVLDRMVRLTTGGRSSSKTWPRNQALGWVWRTRVGAGAGDRPRGRYGRTAGTDHRARDEEFFRWENLMSRHLSTLTRDGLFGDFTTAIAQLREECRTIVSIGFCIGGRFAFQTTKPDFGLSGAIGLYGFPSSLNGVPGPLQEAGTLRAPILAFWGGGDEGIPTSVRHLVRPRSHRGRRHARVRHLPERTARVLRTRHPRVRGCLRRRVAARSGVPGAAGVARCPLPTTTRSTS
jgi:hypothetical protein